MIRLMVFGGGLVAQFYIFGLLLLYIVPFFFGVCALVSARDSFVGFLESANKEAAWRDLRDTFSFIVVMVLTFNLIFHRTEIWQWLQQFI